MIHQCYYCDQIFDSKERLFDHLESHSDTKTRELKVKKQLKKKLEKTLKKDRSHMIKMSSDEDYCV